MPRSVALPRISLVACASIGALVGVLLAVLVGLVHPLDVQRSAPGGLHTGVTGDITAEEIVPSLVPISVPAPSQLVPDVPRFEPPEHDNHAARRSGRMDICLDASRPACRRMFERALGTNAAAAPGPSAAASSAGAAGADVDGAGAANPAGEMLAGEPLHFSSKPEWVRRLDRLGREGLPFARMPRGPDHELVIGINRKGVLGAFLMETPPSASVAPDDHLARAGGAAD